MARRKKQLPKIVQAWEQYFQKGELDDWQRFMRDLGFTQDFTSKTQCRKVRSHTHTHITITIISPLPTHYPWALGLISSPLVKALVGVWVNIQDFLDAVKKGLPVPRHPSERALAQYTVNEKKIFPKVMIVKGRPNPSGLVVVVAVLRLIIRIWDPGSPLAKLMAHILH